MCGAIDGRSATRGAHHHRTIITSSPSARTLTTTTTQRQARSARAKQEAEAAAKAALAEDPSIYDYDGVYDAMQAERGERARAAQAAAQEEKQQSKYIDSLKRVRCWVVVVGLEGLGWGVGSVDRLIDWLANLCLSP